MVVSALSIYRRKSLEVWTVNCQRLETLLKELDQLLSRHAEQLASQKYIMSEPFWQGSTGSASKCGDAVIARVSLP